MKFYIIYRLTSAPFMTSGEQPTNLTIVDSLDRVNDFIKMNNDLHYIYNYTVIKGSEIFQEVIEKELVTEIISQVEVLGDFIDE